MYGMSALAVLVIVLFLMLLTKMPLAIALGISSMFVLIMDNLAKLSLFVSAVYTATDSYPLVSVPLFIVMGDIMCKGGIAKRLVDFTQKLVSSVTGGLGLVGIISCFLFASISGSGPATVAAIGGILVPYMVSSGYERNYSAALIGAAGSMGPIVPPSITFILFGSLVGVSIGDLFIAGVVPGILIAISLAIVNYFISKKRGYRGTGEKSSFKEILKATYDAKLALLTPIIVLGGIYGGVFTPTEAAAIGVYYGLIVSIFVYKELSFKELPALFMSSSATTAGILIILGVATFFGRTIGLEHVPRILAEAVGKAVTTPAAILLIINMVLLVAGMFLDTPSAMMIFVPLLMPIATNLGVDPIHLGMIVAVNLTLGTLSPPLGLNVFVASRIGETSYELVFKHIVPFFIATLIVLLIITFVPSLSTFLPNLLK